jgi:hypothetical protein
MPLSGSLKVLPGSFPPPSASVIVLKFARPVAGPLFLGTININLVSTATSVSGRFNKGKGEKLLPLGVATLQVPTAKFDEIGRLLAPAFRAFAVELTFDGLTVSELTVTEVAPAAAPARSAMLSEGLEELTESHGDSDVPPSLNEPSFQGNEAAVAFRSS